MKSLKPFICGAVLAGVFSGLCFLAKQSEGRAAMADTPEPHLVHNVFFKLKDSTPENCQQLVASCKKYLTDHPGTVYFAAGTLSDLDRPVNDRDFDVGLHVIFVNRAAHDEYQTAERHLQFIAENRETWENVRVFDSDAFPVAAAE